MNFRCKGRVSSLLCVIKYFRNKCHRAYIPSWDDKYEWYVMNSMTGLDCAVMCNQVNIHTHTNTHKPGSAHEYRTEGITGSEGREKAYGVGCRIGVGGGNADGNGVGGVNRGVNGEWDGTGAGKRTALETTLKTQDGNGDRSEDGVGTGTGTEREQGREQGWRPVEEHRIGTETGAEI